MKIYRVDDYQFLVMSFVSGVRHQNHISTPSSLSCGQFSILTSLSLRVKLWGPVSPLNINQLRKNLEIVFFTQMQHFTTRQTCLKSAEGSCCNLVWMTACKT